MEKRFEESFNEIGLIYEAFTQKAGGQLDSTNGEHSYRKGHMTGPGGPVNTYAANMNSAGGGPVSDEEVEEDPIIAKIEEMEKEAADHGQDYAMLQLAELKMFIEKL